MQLSSSTSFHSSKQRPIKADQSQVPAPSVPFPVPPERIDLTFVRKKNKTVIVIIKYEMMTSELSYHLDVTVSVTVSRIRRLSFTLFSGPLCGTRTFLFGKSTLVF